MNNIIKKGEQIALIADCHAMYEPVVAALESIKSRGINKIYSLGDNIGTGPSPKEVLNLLREYNVISVAGNAEDYMIYGINPYRYIIYDKTCQRKKNVLWTRSMLDEDDIREIKLYPRSIDLLIGNKKIALCHFSSDVRFSYLYRTVNNYITYFNIETGKKVINLNDNYFKYTNTIEELNFVLEYIEKNRRESISSNPLIDSLSNRLFNGKKISEYNTIFQGHSHFRLIDEMDTNIYSLRGVGMGWSDSLADDYNCASYLVITALEDGFKVEEVNDVEFDIESLHYNIINSENNNPAIRKFVGISDKCKVKKISIN